MIFNEKWPFYKMMKTTFFGNFMILQNIRLLQFCVAPIWKWNVTHLCTLKFTEETLMFTQCVQYAGVTIFPKNNWNFIFRKSSKLSLKLKMWKNGCVTILLKTMRVMFKKHCMCINVHRNSRRKTLCLMPFT